MNAGSRSGSSSHTEPGHHLLGLNVGQLDHRLVSLSCWRCAANPGRRLEEGGVACERPSRRLACVRRGRHVAPIRMLDPAQDGNHCSTTLCRVHRTPSIAKRQNYLSWLCKVQYVSNLHQLATRCELDRLGSLLASVLGNYVHGPSRSPITSGSKTTIADYSSSRSLMIHLINGYHSSPHASRYRCGEFSEEKSGCAG